MKRDRNSSRLLVSFLIIAAVSVWSYVAGKIWTVASTPELSPSTSVPEPSQFAMLSVFENGRFYFADFADPFIDSPKPEETEDSVETENAVEETISNLAPAISLIGTVGNTALVSTPDEPMLLVSKGDSLSNGVVVQIQPYTLTMRIDDDTHEINARAPDDSKFSIAKQQ